jgi:mismatch-specific thymine-DNA glycosylase
MARTRSAKGNAANVPKFEPGNNDDISIEREVSNAQVATDPIVPVAFKATLDRFRHKDTENHVSEAKNTQDYRNGRKRPLNSLIKREEADSATASPSPAKRRRQPSKYAPPSLYSHLPTLVDVLEPDLICVFVGTNPGIRTATSGHAYAHPSNMFWKLLHSSGCTDERLKPEQDVDLPRLYSIGNTNIVERPSKNAAELSKAEMTAGTPILEEKVRKYRPEAICVVGKGIWEAIWKWRYGKQIKKDEFHYGWQDDLEKMGKCDDWEGARIFVSSSTSGLSASTKPHEKEAIWKPFGEWVQARRKQRAAEVDGLVKKEAVERDPLKKEIVKAEPVFEEPAV